MLINTRAVLADLVTRGTQAPPCADPAQLVLPTEGGSQELMRWIGEQTGRPTPAPRPRHALHSTTVALPCTNAQLLLKYRKVP